MTISLYKYKCQLNIDGSIVSTFHINEQLYDEIMDALANQPAVFPVRFTFCRVNKLDGIMAQLLILRNVKRYKVIVRENFILLIRRKNRKRPQEEFVFWVVLLIREVQLGPFKHLRWSFFAKKVNRLYVLSTYAKRFNLDVWLVLAMSPLMKPNQRPKHYNRSEKVLK